MASEWKELTEVLEKQVTATVDPEAKIPVYKRLGRIWGEKLSRERNALESWLKVLELDPQDVDALRALAATPAGPWLLALVAIGLIMFGLFSCCEARWRRF